MNQTIIKFDIFFQKYFKKNQLDLKYSKEIF